MQRNVCPHIQHFNCNYFITVEAIRKIINLYVNIFVVSRKFKCNL